MCCHAGAKSLVGAVGELLVKGPVRGFPRLQRGSKLLGMGHIYIYICIYIYTTSYKDGTNKRTLLCHVTQTLAKNERNSCHCPVCDLERGPH